MHNAFKNERISFDGGTILMNFLIKDDDLLKKYSDIWNKVSSNTKKKNLITNPSTLKNVGKMLAENRWKLLFASVFKIM